MTPLPPELNDEADALAVLRALVQQIKGDGYRNRHGLPLGNLIAFREAMALLELRGVEP